MKTVLRVAVVVLFWAFLAASLLTITIGQPFCDWVAGVMGC